MSSPVLTDQLGQPITVGCKVIIASTSKSAGISWKIVKVSRLGAKRFFYARRYGEAIGKPSNALVIDRLGLDHLRFGGSYSGTSTREMIGRELGYTC